MLLGFYYLLDRFMSTGNFFFQFVKLVLHSSRKVMESACDLK